MNKPLHLFTFWALRLSLASAFLSAVADRLGWWGKPGAPNVAWGEWAPFVNYTGHLLGFMPNSWVGFFALTATIAEIVLAIWLIIGIRIQWAAYASAALLMSFAVPMTLADGIKGPLNYSVFTAFAAALAVAVLAKNKPSEE